MKNFIFFSVIIFISLTFYTCGVQKNDISIITKFDYSYDTVFQTYKDDFSKKYTGGIDLHWKDSTTYLVFNFCGANELRIMDFKTDSIQSLFLHNPGCQKVYTQMKGNDFYLLTQDGKLWRYCNNSSDDIEEVFDIRTSSILKKHGLITQEHKPGGDQFVDVPEDIIYFNLGIDFDNEDWEKYHKAGRPIIGKFNIINNKLEVFGKMPKEREDQLYGLVSDISSLYVEDVIYLSYDYNGDITKINTLDNSSTVKTIRSKFDVVPLKKFNRKKHKDDVTNAMMKHLNFSPNYEPLFFNPYNNRFYRVFHPSMSEYNENGLLNTQYDKEAVLMTFDENLNLLDEVLLPIKKAKTLKLIPIEDGVAIFYPELNHVLEDKEKAYAYFYIHQK